VKISFAGSRTTEQRRGGRRRKIAQNPPDVEEAIAAGLALAALYGAMHGWPPSEDPITAREDREMWERFSRLRRHYGYPP
jgi:hypothetical protein